MAHDEKIKEINKEIKERKETQARVREELNEGRRDFAKDGFRETIRKAFSLTADVATHEEIKERLFSAGKITGTNMCVLMLAILIASVGLNVGSTAVIIGAMLISPLMGSILAMAYGTVSADARRTGIFGMGFGFQIVAALVVSTLYFLITPEKAATAELLARTSPSFFDVIIAICGGLAGIIGQTRADKANNIIPGVAIATALMPPLCTCGYSIANGQWKMFLGAGYLFIINCYFIFMSAVVILAILRIPKEHELTPAQWKKAKFRMIRNAVIVVLPCIAMPFVL